MNGNGATGTPSSTSLRATNETRGGLWRGWLVQGLVPMGMLLLCLGLALQRTGEHEARLEDGSCYTSKREIVSIQGNIPQELKHSLKPADLRRMFDYAFNGPVN